MSATIYYFSATGNSLFIARKTAKKLENCPVISMTSNQKQGQIGGPGETVGFVFPVYFIGLPRIVRRFVENLDILPGTYCFAIVDYGGSAMDTLGMLQDILRAKGLELSTGCGIKLPDTWLLKYEASRGARAEKLYRRAEKRIDGTVKDILTKKHQRIRRLWRPLSRKFNQTIYTGIKEWDTGFRVNDRCTGCGLCTRLCPVGNILLTEQKPEWQHNCERCLACVHWCPCAAIDYGDATKGRIRYHHPDVSAQDIMEGRQ